MKILLWKIGALGDVIMTTPLVRQLRKSLPHAQIDYLTGKSCVAVLEGNPHLDHVSGFDEHILYQARLGKVGSVLSLLRGYDLIFILDKHWIFAVLARAAGVPVRVGFSRRWHEGLLHTHRVPYGQLRHEIHCYLDLAQAYGLQFDRTDLHLELPESQPFSLRTPYAVLVNSGGSNANERSEVRKLPDSVFGSLVERCLARGAVVFLGNGAESARYERYASESTVNLCGRLSLKQAWSVLKQAKAIYTTDSGLMHMAAAVNPNVTAVFGPTHPARKCPPNARWVWRDERLYDSSYEVFGAVPRSRYFQNLSVTDVLEGAQPSLLETDLSGAFA